METYFRIYLILIIIGGVLAYRLPETVIPSEYTLEIITHLGHDNDKMNFTGKVWIDVTCTAPVQNITLHSKNLHIDKKHVHVRPLAKDSKSLKVTNIDQSNDDNDFFIIHLSETLKDGHKYIIEISFSGNLDEGLAGYYKSYYTDKKTDKKVWLAVTQFEPSDARRAFPCFDEPGMKAKFTMSLGRHNKYSSLSNMPIQKTEQMKDKPNWEWDRYETSVPMSTYLAAYAVTDFGYAESEKFENNVTFGTWARKDALDQIGFAKDVGPRFLRFYEKYFDIDYPLPKQDMIAIPDFSAGAMENWGLITYREAYLLIDEKQSSELNKVTVASVIAHELAHQWFGNLVTMKWWTDLWLNEGFATYMSAVAVDKEFPKWKHLQTETVENILNVFGFDSLENSHPVSVTIGHPKQISEIFDTISYKKGSYLLHMMANFLGEVSFQQGVSNYLKIHKYGNAEKDDLWKSLTDEAHSNKALPEKFTVKKIMDSWALQTGYPLLTVKRNYGSGTLEVKQERFFKNRELLNTTDTKWWIPLTYTTETNPNFDSMKPNLWFPPDKESVTIEGISKDDDWVIFNIQASGLYVVNYDEKNWNLLIECLKSKKFKNISPINRLLLINNAARLAWIGRLDYKIVFDLFEYLQQETDFLPWKAALQSILNLDTLLKRTSVYGEYKEYMRKVLKPIYNRIGGFRKHEDSDAIDLIQQQVSVTTSGCRYHIENCVSQAQELFKNLISHSSKQPDIPNDLRATIYCTGIKYGGEEEWNILWQMYLNTNVATLKSTILRSLGCTREGWLLRRYLEWTIDEKSGIRKQDMTSVYDSIIQNDAGFFYVKDFVQANIGTIYNRIKPTVGKLSTILSSLAINVIDISEYEWMRNFTKSNQEYFREIKNGVSQALENALLNTQWHQANRGIKEHLKHYKS